MLYTQNAIVYQRLYIKLLKFNVNCNVKLLVRTQCEIGSCFERVSWYNLDAQIQFMNTQVFGIQFTNLDKSNF